MDRGSHWVGALQSQMLQMVLLGGRAARHAALQSCIAIGERPTHEVFAQMLGPPTSGHNDA